ncbi:MAG: HAD family hydrolase [Gammaproteobacteria bacterium]|nr:HAD family hydrolase [Gammaproteobacteria bacterium]
MRRQLSVLYEKRKAAVDRRWLPHYAVSHHGHHPGYLALTLRLEPVEVFVFDFDGTLAPNLDLPRMRSEVIELTLTTGVPRVEFEHLFIIEIVEAVFTRLHKEAPEAASGYRSRAHALITEFELEAAARTEPFPETRRTLRELRRAGKQIAVVTRNCSRAVTRVFGDIDDYCDTVLARDHVTHLKPDLRHVREALTTLGKEESIAAMVGDGRMDMSVGRELGMYCVGVLTGSGDEEQLTNAGADLVIAEIQELLDHV